MGDTRLPFAAAGLAPSATAPIPLSATLNPATGIAEVVFDQPLVPGALDNGNWFVVGDASEWSTLGAVAAASTVTLTLTRSLANPSPGVTYGAITPDVVGLVGGLPAAEFFQFPITVL